MENFKKKSLKFMGMGRDVRTRDVKQNRKQARHERYSLLRDLESVEKENKNHEEATKGNKSTASSLPKSRMQMFQKWKEEKSLKKEAQLANRKPAFKAGLCSKSQPKPDFNISSSKSFIKQSFDVKQPITTKPQTITSRSIPKPWNSKVPLPGTKTVSSGIPTKKASQIPAPSLSRSNSISAVKVMQQVPARGVIKPNVSSSVKSAQQPKFEKKKGFLMPNKTALAKPAQGIQKSRMEKLKVEQDINLNKRVIREQEANVKLCNNKSGTFTSEIGFTSSTKTSFAPKDFKFCPPIELGIFDILKDGLTSVFNEKERSSIAMVSFSITNGRESKKMDQAVENSNSNTKEKYLSENSFDIKQISDLSNCELASNVNSESQVELPKAPLTCNESSENSDKIEGNTCSDKTADENKAKCFASMLSKESNLSSNLESHLHLPETLVSPKELCENSEEDKDKISSNKRVADIKPLIPNLSTDSHTVEPEINCKSQDELPKLPLERKHEIKTRNLRRSKKPILESINEVLENSLSCTPKPEQIQNLGSAVFTPRRSSRLAKLNDMDSHLFENIFDEEKPVLFYSPEEDGVPKSHHTSLSYDFETLHLESTKENQECSPFTVQRIRKSKRSLAQRKVSLLYTPQPKGRKSTRKSIRGDLITFSPI